MANLGGKDLDDEGGSSQEISQELLEEMADTTTNLMKELSKSMAGLSLKSKERSIVSSSSEERQKNVDSDDSACPLVTEAIEYQNSHGFGKFTSSESHSKDKNEEMVDFLNKNLAK